MEAGGEGLKICWFGEGLEEEGEGGLGKAACESNAGCACRRDFDSMRLT